MNIGNINESPEKLRSEHIANIEMGKEALVNEILSKYDLRSTNLNEEVVREDLMEEARVLNEVGGMSDEEIKEVITKKLEVFMGKKSS